MYVSVCVCECVRLYQVDEELEEEEEAHEDKTLITLQDLISL